MKYNKLTLTEIANFKTILFSKLENEYNFENAMDYQKGYKKLYITTHLSIKTVHLSNQIVFLYT